MLTIQIKFYYTSLEKMLLSEPLARLITFFQDEFNKILSQQSTNVRFFLSHK